MWGQQTVLVNQPGAGGATAARAAASAAPDGLTLYMAITSTFTVLPLAQPNLSFNVNDFVPIGFVGEVPIAIAVSPALPVNSLPELIACAVAALIARKFQTVDAIEVVPSAAQAAWRMNRRREISILFFDDELR